MYCTANVKRGDNNVNCYKMSFTKRKQNKKKKKTSKCHSNLEATDVKDRAQKKSTKQAALKERLYKMVDCLGPYY